MQLDNEDALVSGRARLAHGCNNDWQVADSAANCDCQLPSHTLKSYVFGALGQIRSRFAVQPRNAWSFEELANHGQNVATPGQQDFNWCLKTPVGNSFAHTRPQS